jgi:hypothetical protein
LLSDARDAALDLCQVLYHLTYATPSGGDLSLCLLEGIVDPISFSLKPRLILPRGKDVGLQVSQTRVQFPTVVLGHLVLDLRDQPPNAQALCL